MPSSGDFGSVGTPIQQAMELAALEFNEAGGLPGGRHVALLQCDSQGSRERGLALTKYLVETIQTPVILGPAFSSVFIDATTQVTSKAGVMTISPSATSPTITGIEDQGLGWRTVASDTFQGQAIADLIRVRSHRKIIVLGKDDDYGKGLIERVGTQLAPELGEDNYFGLTYPDPSTVENPDYASVVASSLQKLPNADAIVLLGTTEVSTIINLYETALAETSTAVSVNYILADGGKTDETLALAQTDESLIPRIEGTEADHRNAEHYSAYRLRFQNRFNDAPGIYSANGYDAMYLVAYAMSSILPGQEITGTLVADSMKRLVDGTIVKAGPTDINEARNKLSMGSSINYEGASGSLQFDLTTGEAGADVARWIVEKRANGEFRYQVQGTHRAEVMENNGWSLP